MSWLWVGQLENWGSGISVVRDFSVPYNIHSGPAAHRVSDTKGMRVFFFFLQEKRDKGMKLAIYLFLVPTFKMHGAVPPVPQKSLHGA
jgi:hypothetical protein